MDKSENPITNNPRRKFLKMAVSSILLETGFDSSNNDSLETLVEMLTSRKYFFFNFFYWF